MPKRSDLAEKLLIVSPLAGGMTAGVQVRLQRAFPDYTAIEFDPQVDFRHQLQPGAKVVVAGGDGTIGFVARALVDSAHPLGILSLGTYNNFARALGMPKSLDRAIAVVKAGRVRPVTLGRINGHPFLEAAALGLFGEALLMGEAAKERRFGEMRERLAHVSRAKAFSYQLTGDIEGEGTALSLVFANTPSTGARMAVADSTPVEGQLELSVHVGESRRDILGRIVASKVGVRGDKARLGMRFKFRKLKVRASPRVPVFADNEAVGRTPVEITADVGALQIILPRQTAERAGMARRR